jgi:putative ABC transport system permease protein
MQMTLRYAIRSFSKMFRTEFASTVVIVLTLALAIAANAACFGFIDSLMLKDQSGLENSEQLFDLGMTRKGTGFDLLSFPNFFDFQRQSKVFAGLAAYTETPRSMSFRTSGAAERVWGVPVTGNVFDVLQARPAAGRFFLPEDEQPGHELVAIISYSFWDRRFARDAAVVGQKVFVNARPVTIVGVGPKGFEGINYSRTDIWVPLVTEIFHTGEHPFERGATFAFGIGRLKPGISLEQAQAEMNVLSSQLQREYPEDNKDLGVKLIPHNPFSAITMQPGSTMFIGMLFAIAILVLLIACANVAGVCLARSAARTKEFAIRMAIGASRGRLIVGLLAETGVLFVVSGVVAVFMGLWIDDLLARLPQELQLAVPAPIALDLAPDIRVVVFVVALAGLAAVASGLVPALQATRVDPASSMKEEPAAWTFRRSRFRNALVIGQVGTSFLLLVVGGLFVRSLSFAGAVDPGMDPNNVEAVLLNWFISGYGDRDDADQNGQPLQPFEKTVLTRITSLPYVDSASIAVDVPMDGVGEGFNVVTIPGQQSSDARHGVRNTDWNLVSPGYFKTMRIPILRGRDFTESERKGVAIINETMARRFWPGEDPVGKRLYDGTPQNGRLMEIIGVVNDTNARYVGVPADPMLYAPLGQYSWPRHYLMVRTTNGTSVVADLRQILSEINPNMPIISVQSMKDLISVGLLPQRIAAWTATAMGLIGLLLASLGIYGVVAFSATSRTREIGIRTAVGANASEILRLILREGVQLAVTGMVVGWVLAFALTRWIAAFLFRVSPTDGVSLVFASGILAGITLLASYLPARRAMKGDPMIALRHE